MFCTKCGAPLKEGLRFCTACGAKVETPGEQVRPAPPPRTGPRGRAGWRAALAPAVLAVITLAVALGAFLWATAPRPTTPGGALALLVEGLAEGDGPKAARAVDLPLGELAGLRSMTPAQGQAALLSALRLPLDTDTDRSLRSARPMTASLSYTNNEGTACRGSALVRLNWADGTRTTALLPDVTLEYGGAGWHIVSGLVPII